MKNKINRALYAFTAVILVFSLILAGCGGTAGQGRQADQTVTQSADQSATQAPEQSVSAEQPETAASAGQAAVSGMAAEQTGNAGGTAAAASAPKFPMKVKDAGGFEMTIPAEPKRIVSLTLGSDEMLLGLVDSGRVIALTKYADDPGISNISAEAKNIAERVTTHETEKIIALKPDLVVLDTWTDPKYVKQLRDAGITVYAFKTPSGIDGQKAVISELARITGADEKGNEMLAWMDSKLQDVANRLSKLKPEEKLTVMDYGELGSSGKGTNFDDIVTRAGLVNVVSKAGMEGWPVVSKEKIIEMNPDIIILPSWYYDPKNTLQGMIDKLKKDKSLQTVKAISGNRLISVPNPHISAISQYVVLGVEDVAKAAYPELFK